MNEARRRGKKKNEGQAFAMAIGGGMMAALDSKIRTRTPRVVETT